ncbi:ABC transporter ATP-binding protein [Nitrosomonas nitrosa]|uniref:ABC transporter ATP-binding protein n=1 Tax=Nitrosomonas nitrosa TaxID=52442 RepID=UPI0023F85AEE|nr:ABC transporter ATP-binding protein [Nitrosomonas nitrosa]MCO6432672.1 ABC transporter ATP-binding protein [Nitrosomonas nitrosa]
MMNELRIENIHAAYSKKEVLRGVSLSVKQGEIVALIGPNGAGKSTLLKVIAGFLKPLQGNLWLDSKDITSFAAHERIGQGIAYFMQGGRVFPNLTVAENLEMGLATLSLQNKKDGISTVLEIFSNLKVSLNRRAGLLSGGERQALALAMVLVRRPHLLLADEPSVGLSPKLVQRLLGKIHELNSIWGTTILLVEQNIREALNIAHGALALVNGEVALETVQPEEWLTNGQLEQLFLGRTQEAIAK